MYEFIFNKLKNCIFALDLLKIYMKSSHKGIVYTNYGLLACFFLFCGKINGAVFPKSNIESIFQVYLEKADTCIRVFAIDRAKIYIDSAAQYEKQVKDPSLLGFLYGKYGDYYSYKLNEPEAHKNYYKAIEYYEKAGTTNNLVQIYHNLAFSFIQKEDTGALKKIIDKLLPLTLMRSENMDMIDTYSIIAFYYGILYNKEKRLAFLDSAVYYDKRAISIFETTDSISPKTVRPEEIAYNYLNVASNLLEEGFTHPDTVSIYLAKAEALANPIDTAMTINLYWIKGQIAYKKGEIERAKQLFGNQLVLMDHWVKSETLFLYADLYQILSEISEKQKDYGKALVYERKRNNYLNQIHDARKYEIIRELETKYEVQGKEQKIVQLSELTHYQKKIINLYFFILVLFFITFFFIANWFRLKKKVNKKQLALIHSEKNEAILQSKLKEEQLKKEKLEKYDVLLDNHFKNKQVLEMDDELEKLKSEQQKLNTLIDEYTDRINSYEKKKSGDNLFMANDSVNSILLSDLFELISRRIKNASQQKEYHERLTTIDDTFFQRLKESAEEELSVLDTKRCLAFLIGMEVPDIAECFSVEQRSIHQAHYRLKNKLKVEKEMDLDIFLKQLI